MAVKKDLTYGNAKKLLLTFALPFLLSNLVQALYNLTDTLIVSIWLNKEGVAATASGGQVLTVLINVASGLSLGGTIVIGRMFGAKDSKNLPQAIGSFLTLLSGLGAVTSVLLIIFARNVLTMINTPPEVLDDSVAFLRIYCTGVFFMFIYNAIIAVLRGVGNSARPLMFVAAGAAVNVALDLVFIAGMGMGVTSAAVATSISIFISCTLSVIYLFRQRRELGLKREHFKPDWQLVLRILKVGLPSAVQSFVFGVSMLTISSIINEYGVAATATVGFGARINDFTLMPLGALSSATSGMVAQALGAAKLDRVKEIMRWSLTYHIISGIFLFSLVQLFPGFFIGIFSQEQEVLELGITYLRCVSFNYLFIMVLSACNALAAGAGHTLYCLCVTVMNAFAFRIPIALFFTNVMNAGIAGAFLGLGFANIGGMFAGIAYYRIGLWKRSINKIPHESGLADIA